MSLDTPMPIDRDDSFSFRSERQIVPYSAQIDLLLPLNLLSNYQLGLAAQKLQDLVPQVTSKLINKTVLHTANVSDITADLRSTIRIFLDEEFQAPSDDSLRLIEDIKNSLPQSRRRRDVSPWAFINTTHIFTQTDLDNLMVSAAHLCDPDAHGTTTSHINCHDLLQAIEAILDMDLPTNPDFNWTPTYKITRHRRNSDSNSDAEPDIVTVSDQISDTDAAKAISGAISLQAPADVSRYTAMSSMIKSFQTQLKEITARQDWVGLLKFVNYISVFLQSTYTTNMENFNEDSLQFLQGHFALRFFSRPHLETVLASVAAACAKSGRILLFTSLQDLKNLDFKVVKLQGKFFLNLELPLADNDSEKQLYSLQKPNLYHFDQKTNQILRISLQNEASLLLVDKNGRTAEIKTSLLAKFCKKIDIFYFCRNVQQDLKPSSCLAHLFQSNVTAIAKSCKFELALFRKITSQVTDTKFILGSAFETSLNLNCPQRHALPQPLKAGLHEITLSECHAAIFASSVIRPNRMHTFTYHRKPVDPMALLDLIVDHTPLDDVIQNLLDHGYAADADDVIEPTILDQLIPTISELTPITISILSSGFLVALYTAFRHCCSSVAIDIRNRNLRAATPVD